MFKLPEKYTLQCEWGQCREVFELMDDFYVHLDQHLQTDVTNVEPVTFLVCQWCECSFCTTNGQDLIRHVYFHGFHTKLKWLGYKKHSETKAGQCLSHEDRNIIPELPDGFKCCWDGCSFVSDIPDKYYEHVKDHKVSSNVEKLSSGKNGFKCRWEGCSYEYVTENKTLRLGRQQLRCHLGTHTQERSFACPWCGNLYINMTKLIDHFTKQIAAEDQNFQCTHCSRTFGSERILKDHMRQHVKYYQCPECAMTSASPSALKNHIRYKHTTARPYACKFCDYRSKEPNYMQKHMELHQRNLRYHCEVEGCNYEVKSMQNLRHHYRSKHGSGDGKYYSCHLCEKKYSTGYRLTQHLKKFHAFQWPPGHSRSRFKKCKDGLHRLENFHYESMEATNQASHEEFEDVTDNLDERNCTSNDLPESSTTDEKTKANRSHKRKAKDSLNSSEDASCSKKKISVKKKSTRSSSRRKCTTATTTEPLTVAATSGVDDSELVHESLGSASAKEKMTRETKPVSKRKALPNAESRSKAKRKPKVKPAKKQEVSKDERTSVSV